jgi:hypothetical protein
MPVEKKALIKAKRVKAATPQQTEKHPAAGPSPKPAPASKAVTAKKLAVTKLATAKLSTAKLLTTKGVKNR